MQSKILIGTLSVVLVASGLLYAKNVASLDTRPMTSDYQNLSVQPATVMNCAKPVRKLTEYKTYTCPLGGETFDVLTYVGKQPELKTMDLRPVSEFSFPGPLPICPSNGFVIDKDEYSEAELASRAKILSDPSYHEALKQNLPSHILALEFLSRLPENEMSDDFDVPVAASILTEEVRSGQTAFERRFAFAPAVPDLARKAGLFDVSVQLIEDTCSCVMVPAMHVLMNKVRRAAEAKQTGDIIVSPDDPELQEFIRQP